MKKNNIHFVFASIIIFMIACSKESIILSEELSTPEYDLPKGAPGSIEEKIYNIHQKYGTYILYSFQESDLKKQWSTRWSKWYIPANVNNNLRYVGRFVDFIEENLLSKFDVNFVRDNFPYKVFLVDSLCDNITYRKARLVNILSNGNNAIAISNVGVASDSWEEADWIKLAIDLNTTFSAFYYSSLTERPIKFIATRSKDIQMLTDPENIDAKYEYSCWSSGYVAGWLNTYMVPKEEQDFADFMRFVTGTSGKELKRIMNRYPLMKERAMALYIYMRNKMSMDMITTQNNNFPDDKLPLNYFNNDTNN